MLKFYKNINFVVSFQEWDFIKSTCPHIPGGESRAGNTFCQVSNYFIFQDHWRSYVIIYICPYFSYVVGPWLYRYGTDVKYYHMISQLLLDIACSKLIVKIHMNTEHLTNQLSVIFPYFFWAIFTVSFKRFASYGCLFSLCQLRKFICLVSLF